MYNKKLLSNSSLLNKKMQIKGKTKSSLKLNNHGIMKRSLIQVKNISISFDIDVQRKPFVIFYNIYFYNCHSTDLIHGNKTFSVS